MKFIPLTQRQCAIVDDIDYDWLSEYNWFAHKKVHSNKINYYACRKLRVVKDNRIIKTTTYMHRIILEQMILEKTIEEKNINIDDYKFLTDHVNRNGLDNRRSNLRFCTSCQNQYNRGKAYFSEFPSSIYKGVNYKRNGWEASMSVDHQIIYVGRFSNERLAAFAYDEYARKYHLEFAKLNLPELTEQEYNDLKEQMNDELNWKSSKYRGVVWNKNNQKWVAQLRHNKHLYYLGYYIDEIDAAKAYDRKAVELRGANTRLNFYN